MKKVLCICLAVGIVFLSGCAAIIPPRAGLIEIKGLNENVNYISSADLGEKYWVMLASVFEPAASEESTDAPAQEASGMQADGEEQKAEEFEPEEYDEFEPDGAYYHTLNYVHPRTARVVKSVALKDCPLQDISGVRFEEDGSILVCDEYNKQCVRYCAALERISKALPYEPTDVQALAEKNSLTDERFSNYDSFCHDYTDYGGEALVNCFAFYEEPDSLYFANKEHFSPGSGYGKRVCGSTIEDDATAPPVVRVYDFQSRLMIGEIAAPQFGADKSVYFVNSVLKEDSAFLCFEESSAAEDSEQEPAFQNHYYLWNYTLDAKNTPFDATKKNAAALEADNEAMCREIKNKFGIDVLINQPNQWTIDEDEVYALDLTAPPYQIYATLVGISHFLELFPEEFVKQMYTDNAHLQTKGFEIYIAKAVKGYPNAYANMWGEMLEMALGTSGFNLGTLAHEFMHLIDARLEEHYWEEGLDAVWQKNNPKDFEYLGYQDAGSEAWESEDWSKYEDYFCTAYAMSSAAEDRADTFSSLFESGAYSDKPEKPYWYTTGSPPAKKAVVLCKMIRQIFPSMQNAPLQVWEKSIAADLKA